jgi:parvulin-like peptidyl-prolyl isomerase
VFASGRIILLRNIFILFITVVLIGCGRGGDKVVARIGSEKILLSELSKQLGDLPSNYDGYLKSEVGRKQIIDLLVKEKVLLEEAKKKGIHKRKEIIEEIKDFKDNYKKQFEEYKNNLYVSTFLKELQEKEIFPTEGEVESYYDKNKKQFTNPVETEVSHILVPTDKEAKEALKKIRSGKNFAELAEEVSIDPSSNALGGKLGTFRQGELLPEFESVVNKLKVGEVSDVVYTSFGYHIIKKTDQKILPAQPFKDVKSNIQRLLVKDMFDKWMDNKRQELNVKIDFDMLKSIEIERPLQFR